MIIRFPDKRQAGTRYEEPAYLMDLGPTILSMYGIAIPANMHGRDLLGRFRPTAPRPYLFFTADRFDDQYDLIRAVSNGQYKYIRNFQPHKPQFLNLAFRKRQDGVMDLYRLDSLGQLSPDAQTVMRKTKPTEELFHIVNDPHELNNLAKDSRYQAVLQELKLALDQWMQEVRDLGFTPEKEIADRCWPGGQQPVTANPEIRIQSGRVHLACTSSGATIGYKINQQAGWTIYTQPFSVKKGDSIEVMAHRLGYKSSAVVKQAPMP
jgi:protein-tyrosine-phosphatase